MNNVRKPRMRHKIEMEEGMITFPTSKLAKEKGCDLNTVTVYDAQGDFTLDIGVNNEDVGMDNEAYPAYTQSLLQKWLREKHNIQIVIEVKQKDYEVYEYKYESCIFSSLIEKDWENDCIFDTYELALEDALQDGLKLIKPCTKI